VRKRSLILISLLFLTIPLIRIGASSPATKVYVDPAMSEANVGETFNVLVKIADVTDAFSLQFYLGWNSTVMNATAWSEGGFLNQGGVTETYPIFKVYNDRGEVRFWNTIQRATRGVDGSGVLANITFTMTHSGETGLFLYQVKIADSFLHTLTNIILEDGYLNVTPPMFHVEPSSILDPTLKAGSTFVVNLTLTDVVEAKGFEFKLHYNGTLLNATNVSTVPFLNEAVTADVGFNNTLGYVWINMTSNATTGVSKSGPVANVTFVVNALGQTLLELNVTRLDDKLARVKTPPFEHRPPVENGYFSNIPPLQHDIEVSRISVLPTTLTAGEIVSINATLKNLGAQNETFDVTVYHTQTVVITKQTGVTLLTAEKKTLQFTWNTEGLVAGSYIIKVEAQLSGDEKPSNNALTFGPITVKQTATTPILLYAGVGVGIAIVVMLVLYFIKFRKPKT